MFNLEAARREFLAGKTLAQIAKERGDDPDVLQSVLAADSRLSANRIIRHLSGAAKRELQVIADQLQVTRGEALQIVLEEHAAGLLEQVLSSRRAARIARRGG